MVEEQEQVFSHIARVRQVTPEQRDAIVRVGLSNGLLDEDILQEKPPFYWRAEISNELLDSHFTHMSERTLKNYVRDAKLGVAFLRGHNHRELPIGYSLDATLGDGEVKRVNADFYTITGLPDTDDIVYRMRGGLVRDVSVGFHGGQAICDICHQDFWDCRHYPGLYYEEKEGDTVKRTLATFTIDDAGLSEVSGVFDGSTPQAMILKAERAAKRGDLTRQQVYLLEQCYRTRLAARTNIHVGFKGGEEMQDEGLKQLRTILFSSGIVPKDQRNEEMDEQSALTYVEQLSARTKTLEKQAEDGRTYRADLVTEALAEGVRAMGEAFDADGYKGILESASVDAIKRFRQDWKSIADRNYTGGRQSVDTSQPPQPEQEVKVEYVPDEAYA